MSRPKLKTAAINLGADEPQDLVRIYGSDIRIGDRYIGSESLFHDISLVADVWRPVVETKWGKPALKMFVVRKHVADVVQLWLETSDPEDILVGYAGMPLREYLKKMLDDGEKKTQS